MPAGVSATGGLEQVALNWSAASDNVGVVRYNVHRSTVSGFTPSAGNRVAQPTGTSYTDIGLAPGTYYYKVTAQDAAANVSAASAQVNALAAAEQTPPSVSMTSPTAGATLAGTATVAANASDNRGVASVQFRVDGQNLGAADTSAPYSLPWNTTTSTEGAHTVTAVARDAAGNSATSQQLAVTVDNVPAPDTQRRRCRLVCRRRTGWSRWFELVAPRRTTWVCALQPASLDLRGLHAFDGESCGPAGGHELHRSRSARGRLLLPRDR